MKFAWPITTIKRQRDYALVRVVQLEARLAEAQAASERLRSELQVAAEAVERLTDNVLFGAGMAPIYHPEHERFQVRPKAEQAAGVIPAKTLSPGEWRRRAEELDLKQAERDRKAELATELKNMAAERVAQKTRSSDGAKN